MAFLVGKALPWKCRWVSAAGTGEEVVGKEAPQAGSHLVELGMFKTTHPRN